MKYLGMNVLKGLSESSCYPHPKGHIGMKLNKMGHLKPCKSVLRLGSKQGSGEAEVS